MGCHLASRSHSRHLQTMNCALLCRFCLDYVERRPPNIARQKIVFCLERISRGSMSDLSKEEKRAFAIAKLAKVFGKNRGRPAVLDSDSEDEEDVFEAILEATTLEEAQSIARKRLDKFDSTKRYAELVKQEKADAAVNPPRIDAVLRALHKETHIAAATMNSYWESNFEHGLTVDMHEHLTDSALRLSVDEARDLNQHLARTGYFSSRPMDWGSDVSLSQIIAGMAELKRKGWPSAFVFAYKQPWLVIERLFDFAASVMGTDDLSIEPSVFAWLLDPPSSSDVSKAGNNGYFYG